MVRTLCLLYRPSLLLVAKCPKCWQGLHWEKWLPLHACRLVSLLCLNIDQRRKRFDAQTRGCLWIDVQIPSASDSTASSAFGSVAGCWDTYPVVTLIFIDFSHCIGIHNVMRVIAAFFYPLGETTLLMETEGSIRSWRSADHSQNGIKIVVCHACTHLSSCAYEPQLHDGGLFVGSAQFNLKGIQSVKTAEQSLRDLNPRRVCTVSKLRIFATDVCGSSWSWLHALHPFCSQNTEQQVRPFFCPLWPLTDSVPRPMSDAQTTSNLLQFVQFTETWSSGSLIWVPEARAHSVVVSLRGVCGNTVTCRLWGPREPQLASTRHCATRQKNNFVPVLGHTMNVSKVWARCTLVNHNRQHSARQNNCPAHSYLQTEGSKAWKFHLCQNKTPTVPQKRTQRVGNFVAVWCLTAFYQS